MLCAVNAASKANATSLAPVPIQREDGVFVQQIVRRSDWYQPVDSTEPYREVILAQRQISEKTHHEAMLMSQFCAKSRRGLRLDRAASMATLMAAGPASAEGTAPAAAAEAADRSAILLFGRLLVV